MYCGVYPQRLATFTTSTTLPLYFARSTAVPSIFLTSPVSGEDWSALATAMAHMAPVDQTLRHVSSIVKSLAVVIGVDSLRGEW